MKVGNNWNTNTSFHTKRVYSYKENFSGYGYVLLGCYNKEDLRQNGWIMILRDYG
jgi:hypothetical protein